MISSAKKWKAGDKENGLDHTRTQICKRENTFRGVKKGFFVCLFLYLLESETKAWPMSLRGEKKWVRHPGLLASCAKENGDMEQKGRGGEDDACKKYVKERERKAAFLYKCYFPNSKSIKAEFRIFFAFLLSLSFILRIFPLGVKGEWLTPTIESELEPVPSTLLSSGVHLPLSLILLSSMLTTKRHLSESGRMERKKRRWRLSRSALDTPEKVRDSTNLQVYLHLYQFLSKIGNRKKYKLVNLYRADLLYSSLYLSL